MIIIGIAIILILLYMIYKMLTKEDTSLVQNDIETTTPIIIETTPSSIEQTYKPKETTKPPVRKYKDFNNKICDATDTLTSNYYKCENSEDETCCTASKSGEKCNYSSTPCKRLQYKKEPGQGKLGDYQHGWYYDVPETQTMYKLKYKDWKDDKICDAIDVADSNFKGCDNPYDEICCKDNYLTFDKRCIIPSNDFTRNDNGSPCGRTQLIKGMGAGPLANDKYGFFYELDMEPTKKPYSRYYKDWDGGKSCDANDGIISTNWFKCKNPADETCCSANISPSGYCPYDYSPCARFQYDKKPGEGQLGEKQYGFYWDTPENPSDYSLKYKDFWGTTCNAIDVRDTNYWKCESKPEAEKCCGDNITTNGYCKFKETDHVCELNPVKLGIGEGPVSDGKYGYFYEKK